MWLISLQKVFKNVGEMDDCRCFWYAHVTNRGMTRISQEVVVTVLHASQDFFVGLNLQGERRGINHVICVVECRGCRPALVSASLGAACVFASDALRIHAYERSNAHCLRLQERSKYCEVVAAPCDV